MVVVDFWLYVIPYKYIELLELLMLTSVFLLWSFLQFAFVLLQLGVAETGHFNHLSTFFGLFLATFHAFSMADVTTDSGQWKTEACLMQSDDLVGR